MSASVMFEGMMNDLEKRRMREAHGDHIQRMASSIAATLADKYALRVALAMFDPNHPLLVDKILQEKVREAGKRAELMTDDYEAARDAGRTFKYEYTPPKAADEDLQLANIGNYAEKHALRAELKKLDDEHPLTFNQGLLERIHRAGQLAFQASGGDYKAVADAGKSFAIDGYTSWDRAKAGEKLIVKYSPENIRKMEAIYQTLAKAQPGRVSGLPAR